jgi:Zn finger protein HypA/HybF involved in hydrogenase expression
MKKLTTEEFIEKAIKVHGDRYDYSSTNYCRNRLKVMIICKKHGSFQQTPSSHLLGSCCPKCQGKSRLTNDEFIKKAKKIHNNRYNYSIVNYVNNHTKVKIICLKHGEFEQIPTSHLQNKGCPKCANKNVTTDEFIEKCKIIHKNKYDYSLVNYITSTSKIDIICKKHGSFQQIPNSHLNGQGCPICKSSKGELLIKEYLDKHKIPYIKEKMFDDCKGEKRKLPFDYYLPQENILIEYDGIQHLKSIKHFGGEKTHISLKIRDEIKNLYAKKHNIFLLRIKYNEINNIEKILNNIL